MILGGALADADGCELRGNTRIADIDVATTVGEVKAGGKFRSDREQLRGQGRDGCIALEVFFDCSRGRDVEPDADHVDSAGRLACDWDGDLFRLQPTSQPGAARGACTVRLGL